MSKFYISIANRSSDALRFTVPIVSQIHSDSFKLNKTKNSRTPQFLRYVNTFCYKKVCLYQTITLTHYPARALRLGNSTPVFMARLSTLTASSQTWTPFKDNRDSDDSDNYRLQRRNIRVRPQHALRERVNSPAWVHPPPPPPPQVFKNNKSEEILIFNLFIAFIVPNRKHLPGPGPGAGWCTREQSGTNTVHYGSATRDVLRTVLGERCAELGKTRVGVILEMVRFILLSSAITTYNCQRIWKGANLLHLSLRYCISNWCPFIERFW